MSHHVIENINVLFRDNLVNENLKMTILHVIDILGVGRRAGMHLAGDSADVRTERCCDFDLDGDPMNLRMVSLLALALVPFTLSPAVNAQGGRTYSTNFPLTENPLSEGGNWINGQTVALDWKNFRTTAGFAFGTQNGSGGPPYDDSTALLSGTWGPDQSVQATVRTTNQRNDSYQEVELRLRSTLSPHVNSGYEINWRCTHDGSQYQQIVRFNGPINSYQYLSDIRGGRGLYDGDVIRATMIGNVITVYQNGTQIAQVSDSTFTSGSPGIGHWLRGPADTVDDYGFTSVSASDGPPMPSPPTNVRVVTSAAFGAQPFGLLDLHRVQGLNTRSGS